MPFDALEFVANRNAGLKVSEQEIMDFLPYNAFQAISMDARFIKQVTALNTIEFSKLPKEAQAKIFNGFNNRGINVTWCRAKAADNAAKEKFIEKAMTIYKMPYNTVVECMRHGLLDINYIEETYACQYEGRVIKTRKPSNGNTK